MKSHGKHMTGKRWLVLTSRQLFEAFHRCTQYSAEHTHTQCWVEHAHAHTHIWKTVTVVEVWKRCPVPFSQQQW